MAPIPELQSRADFDGVLKESYDRPVALLKHSVMCGRSQTGRHEFLKLQSLQGISLYIVIVQHARDVSNYISETLGVVHHTPQALVLFRGRALFHAHHGQVTAEALRSAIHEAASSPS